MNLNYGQGLILLSLLWISKVCGLAASALSKRDLEDKFEVKSGSQCFHVKGVPTLKLMCPNNQLIKVHQSFYGAPPQNNTCRYSSDENHCLQLTDQHENCMGRYTCSVYVSNPFLMNCRVYANYMQVNYSCIPKTRVHNICQSAKIVSQRGFIRTPNYPDSNYTSNLNCACRLKTEDSGFQLQILDFTLNHTKQGICESDFLKISSWGKKCGYIGPERLPERLEIKKREITLQFKSDGSHNARGFWMEFAGSSQGKVTMTCGQVLTAPPAQEVQDLSPPIHIKPVDYPSDDETNEVIKAETEAPPIQEADPDAMFDTYDFPETQNTIQYNVDDVQIITGCVVGVLILIAVIIIIVLVFRR